MLALNAYIEKLPARHQSALKWFFENQNKEQNWPQPLDDGTLLVIRPKGIYKPQWSKYALSVREAISSQYDDRRPKFRENGTWSYEYYQENLNLEAVRRNYSNIALNQCIKDRIPVGVMRQTEARPNSKYLILGVALVVRWNEGYYLLEGFSKEGRVTGI